MNILSPSHVMLDIEYLPVSLNPNSNPSIDENHMKNDRKADNEP